MNRPVRENVSAGAILTTAIFLGIVVLFAAWGSSGAVEYLSARGTPPWMPLFVNYSIMMAATLVLVLASSMGDPARFGFARPGRGGYGASVTGGLVLGIIATIVAMVVGRGGVQLLSSLGFWEMVLIVWLFASVAEELLVRGYVQGYMDPLISRGFTAFGLRISLPVIISALFFSAMHLILLARGTAPMTVYVIMVFAFALGLLAAYQRERTGSVLPPIAAHVFFNVGGVIGGILYVIAQIVIFGRTAAEVARIVSG